MALETAEYIDDLQPDWPLNTDVVSAGDDHLRLIKQVLQNTFPYVSGPVGVSDVVLTRGAVPISAVTVFYMAAAPTGWTRSDPAATSCMRVVPTGVSGGSSGGTHDPVYNARVPAHYHVISLTSAVQNANHTHTVSGTSATEASHTHAVSIASDGIGSHSHYVSITSSSTGVVTNNGNIPSGGAGGNAALSASDAGTHTHSVVGYTGLAGLHSHMVTGTSGAGSAHSHAVNLTSLNQSANHAHTVSGNSATATVTEGGGSLGYWQPRYMDVIMCTRTS